jgi:hypothetical protein
MGDNERFHREDPERGGPVRDFSGLYQGPGSDSKSGEPPGSPSNAAGGDQGPAPQGGVGLAYSVIEKHISDGKRSAGQFNNKPYHTSTMTDGLQETLERTIRSQVELIPLWIEALGSAVKVYSPRMPYPPGSVANAEANGVSKRASSEISIEVASLRPVRVSIHFSGSAETRPAVMLRHGIDETKPVLTDISFVFDASSGAMIVRILIPDSQPPGVYSGVIVGRETGEPLGTLSVRIAD